MEIIQNQTPTEERLPWHKPELERLSVTLDTQDLRGSGTDGADRSTD
jgi:hypothetical protein